MADIKKLLHAFDEADEFLNDKIESVGKDIEKVENSVRKLDEQIEEQKLDIAAMAELL